MNSMRRWMLLCESYELPSVVFHGTCRHKWSEPNEPIAGVVGEGAGQLYLTANFERAKEYALEWEDPEPIVVEFRVADLLPLHPEPNWEWVAAHKSWDGSLDSTPSWQESLAASGTFCIRLTNKLKQLGRIIPV